MLSFDVGLQVLKVTHLGGAEETIPPSGATQGLRPNRVGLRRMLQGHTAGLEAVTDGQNLVAGQDPIVPALDARAQAGNSPAVLGPQDGP